MVGTQTDCRSAHPLTDLSHAIVPLLAGWMAAKMICGILFCLFKKPWWLHSPVSTAWLAHNTFLLLFLLSNTEPHMLPAPLSRAGNRVFHILTRHVPWNCSMSSKVSGHSCVTQRKASTWHATNNISHTSASLWALLNDIPDKYGESGGCAGLLVEMRLASLFRFARANIS